MVDVMLFILMCLLASFWAALIYLFALRFMDAWEELNRENRRDD